MGAGPWRQPSRLQVAGPERARPTTNTKGFTLATSGASVVGQPNRSIQVSDEKRRDPRAPGRLLSSGSTHQPRASLLDERQDTAV